MWVFNVADKNIKKVIVPPANLLSVNVDSTTGLSQYFVRYRIVSEDKSRQSAWSPIHNVQARTVQTILGTKVNDVRSNISSNGDRVTLTWSIPTADDGSALLKTTGYDIYVKWFNAANQSFTSDYVYAGTSNSNSFNIAIPQNLTGVNSVQFWIQVSTFPKLKSDAAKIIETAQRRTAYVISGGKISNP